jgi:hypothetical protein
MTRISVFLTLPALALLGGQVTPPKSGLLSRCYREGETLTYHMTGSNDGRRYEIRAEGVVKRSSRGGYVEEYAWSGLTSNGSAVTLSQASSEFRQTVSLSPDQRPWVPNLAGVNPMLIGPITDFANFYVDLWLANQLGKLSAAGDHVYQEHGTPASWADGHRITIGEDSFDFDLTLANIDPPGKVATLVVRHVPPKEPRLTFPAAWMREPVADTPNNWVNVEKQGDRYVAAVGKETFDVTMEIDLADGKILSGTIKNPVIARERVCADAALANCGTPRPREIQREIKISLDR